jgi:iron complex transport system ATP-binding protein
VTHHLEEVPPFITHALVLADGRVVGSGRADEVLTPECLSAAFGAHCHVAVDRAGGRRRFRLWVGRP